MPKNREAIRNDKAFDKLTEAILDRDQPRTADIFFRMVREEGRSVGEALSVVAEAEAPFVQVPSHINLRDGAISLVNNDHTILGLRASSDLAPYVPEEYRLLPLLQSVWYIPAGLDIWNQLLFRYPGRYATMKGVTVPPPSYGPVVWHADAEPIRENGGLAERLDAYTIATVSGDASRSYALFLGLADEPEARAALADRLMFLGLIDIQDTVAGRKARNTGHKALRARAIADLSDLIGWDNAHGVLYMGVPDMAVGPLYYSLYDAVCVIMAAEFPDAGKSLGANKTPLDQHEIEEMVRLLMESDQASVWDRITAHLKAGKSIGSIGDAIQIGAAELILRITVPRDFTNGQHPFDYCNTANYWLRRSGSDLKPRILYLMANFVNDAARTFKLQSPAAEPAHDFSRQTPEALLSELDAAILAFDIPRTTQLAEAYLRSGADLKPYFATVAVTASKFQDDPHNQKITHSSFEEYAHNTTHLKDRLLMASARLLAGWVKMPGERECHARFMKDWIRH